MRYHSNTKGGSIMSIFEKGKWIWISDKEVPDSYAEFYDMVIFGVFYIPSMNLPKAKGVRTVSLLSLTEKTQQQKVPTDQSNGLWELFLYRQKKWRREAFR